MLGLSSSRENGKPSARTSGPGAWARRCVRVCAQTGRPRDVARVNLGR